MGYLRNIPLFTTESGAASLTLKEIPYTAEAYVRLQHTSEPEKLLKECLEFCTAAGAHRIYATGHECLKKYPYHTSVWRMCRLRDGLQETDAALFPVQQETLEQWRTLYNEKMRTVPNSSYMTLSDAQALLKKGTGYFVHKKESVLGIGAASGETLDAVIAAVPGAGQEVVSALNHALSGDRIMLEVASENHRAVRLYNRLGFLKTDEVSCWYRLV